MRIMQQCNEEKCSLPMIVSITITSKFFKGKGCGTGFFVRENLIATNIHCIAGATSVSVKLLNSNSELDVEGVVAFDDKNDLVILKVSGIGTPFPIAISDILKNGDVVKAVGCISGKHVTAEGEFHCFLNNRQWLQTTAKIKDGYSGGPLLDGKGLVIGINFVSRDNCSEAISSNILTALVEQTNTIESLDQWQKEKTICGWSYIVQSKEKEKEKDFASVIACYDEAIQLNPDIIKWHYNRGFMKVTLAKSEYEEGNLIEAQELRKSAIVDYTQAINLCQDYAESYNNLADTKLHVAKYESESGNVEKFQELCHGAMIDINIAIKQHLKNPIEEDPNAAQFYHTRGEIKEEMGDFSGAKDDFKEAIKNTEYRNVSTVSDDLKYLQDKLKQQE